MAASSLADVRGAAVGRQVRDGLMRYVGVLGALAVLVVWLSTTQSQFLTSGNLLSILEANAALLVVTVGMTFVMIVGGFDLSVGGMLALTTVLLAWLIQNGFPVVLAMLVAVVGATLLGLVVNGMLIARVGLSFFVVTLGTASLFRGLALVQTNGETQGLYEVGALSTIRTGTVLGIPAIAVIALVVLALGIVIMNWTGFGRHLYAVGGNADAARLAGINVTAVRVAAYAIVGACAGVAGVLFAARLGSASPEMGLGIELTAAAAVLVGGTTLMGGSGGLVGSLLGVLFLGVLSNGLTLAGISSFWQGVVTGTVLVLAVLFDRFRPDPAR